MPILGEIRSSKELGYKGNDKRIWAKCELCGGERWTFTRDGKPKHPRCRHCALKDREGIHNSNWKGGRYYSNGWIRVWQPNHPNADHWGYVLEHRLVLEEKLGRLLKPSEIGHHLNGIKDDNRPENLIVMTRKHSSSTLVEPYKQRIRELEIAIEKLIGGDK